MTSTMALERDVRHELHWHPAMRRGVLTIRARDGVVTVEGQVRSQWEKDTVIEAVQGVAGVRAVADEMKVRIEPGQKRTDTQVAAAVAEVLTRHVTWPPAALHARVQDGWVTLTGDVEWHYQKRAAVHAVKHLVGVNGVIDEIGLTPRADVGQVKQDIEAALRRYADVDARGIRVEARGSDVILHGAVHSAAERGRVERAAWASAGVSRVTNELVITSNPSAENRPV